MAVSHWPLARTVARAGQLGVVSGTGIDNVFVRRLQDHGVDGGLRAVLDRFPLQSVVDNVLSKFAKLRRTDASTPYRVPPMMTHRNVQSSQDLLVLAAYAEVAQAKSGHDGIVGINLLTKVQVPTVPTLFGAMLAGVDYVLMGAGIPVHIPGILDRLARGESVDLPLDVEGEATKDQIPFLRFNPRRLLPQWALHRPDFLGIVSSHVLATALSRRSTGVVNGFVVESPIAGGHNAPPRGVMTVDEEGSPVYGERDRVDYDVMNGLGVPFWLAGGITSPVKVREALDVGATGVQVGTLFAYCRESGMESGLKQRVIDQVRSSSVHVTTSTRASSTGYPFKVANVEGTLSDPEVYEHRARICDLGYLREAFMKDDGSIAYRCAAEPLDAYARKGGELKDTSGRTCLCNALMATAGFAQIRHKGYVEPPIVTSGDAINEIGPMLIEHDHYGACDVIAYLEPGIRSDFLVPSDPSAPSGV